jgi:hypothetical protein
MGHLLGKEQSVSSLEERRKPKKEGIVDGRGKPSLRGKNYLKNGG